MDCPRCEIALNRIDAPADWLPNASGVLHCSSCGRQYDELELQEYGDSLAREIAECRREDERRGDRSAGGGDKGPKAKDCDGPGDRIEKYLDDGVISRTTLPQDRLTKVVKLPKISAKTADIRAALAHFTEESLKGIVSSSQNNFQVRIDG